MKKILITAASVIVAAALLGACEPIDTARTNLSELAARVAGTGDANDVQTENGASENSSRAEESNSFSIGVVGIDTWNPLLTQSVTVKEAMELVYDTLFEVNEQHQAVPVLASDYSISPDGRTVTVNLKPDVVWHGGGSFDSYDVVYTVNLIMSGATNLGNALADVAACERAGTNSVKFTLHRSVPDFVSLLTFPIIKYKTSMDYNASTPPNGTGPYSFYGKVGTDKYLLTAFNAYHNGKAAVDTVNIIEAPDMEKYKLMFEASEIDLITDNTVDIVNSMPRGNIKTISYISDKMTYLGFNTASSVLSTSATRKGISNLVDRDGIVSAVLYSKGKAAKIPINPESYLYYDTSESFGIDYEEAYSEFESDGWTAQEMGFTRTANGVEQALSVILLVNSDDATKLRTAEKIKEGLERFGVKVILDKQPYDAYEAKLNAHNFDLVLGEIHLAANNDLTPLTGAGNYFSYVNENVNTLIAQSGMTSDTAAKQQLFINLGEQLSADMPFAPLYFASGCVISGNKIKSGIEPTVSSDYRAANLWKCLN